MSPKCSVPLHGLEYLFKYGSNVSVRSYSGGLAQSAMFESALTFTVAGDNMTVAE
jgi:hypothetical protein